MMNLKEGKLILVDTDGNQHEIEPISHMEVTLAPDIAEDYGIPFETLSSATFTTHMTKEQYFRMIDTFTGLFKMICELCPNKKVTHLATYGKKRRTRKKNRTRMIRILERMR